MRAFLGGAAAAATILSHASHVSAATKVIIVGVENLRAKDLQAFNGGHGGFGRLLESGVMVADVPLETWEHFLQPRGQAKSFFNVVNDRVVEMKEYHLVVSDKFPQDFQSAAYHSWPHFNTLLEKGVSVPCPPYTTRSWSPPCTALQEVQLLHSCVAYDENSFEITGAADCSIDGVSSAAAAAANDEAVDPCASCQEAADAEVVAAIVASLSSSTPGNIVLGYLQSQQLSDINKSLHTLITAIDNAEDDSESWSSYSIIVTGGTRGEPAAEASAAWLAYGVGLASAGAVVNATSPASSDITLGTTLKLLGLDNAYYSTPPSGVFSAPKSAATGDAVAGANGGSMPTRNCQMHNGLQGACPSDFEAWLYKEFPEHVALFSFMGGMLISLGLVVLTCVGYIVGRAAIIGSKKVLGYRTVGTRASAPETHNNNNNDDVEDGGKPYADAADSDSD